MCEYSQFANVYDKLMDNADYGKRTEYLCNLFNKFDRMPTLLLDAACGTGNFSISFASRGIDVIGVDISEEMLTFAKEKCNIAHKDILFLCQPLQELNLYGTVDGVICCLDSLNHITDYNMLCEAFNRISLFLEKDRLFIFDVNTVYKHKNILSDNTFVIDKEDIYCVWQNSYCNKSKTTDINLDFFIKKGNNYIKQSDYFSERAYTSEELERAITNSNLEIVAIYDEMTQNCVNNTTQRAVYITRKTG